MGLWGSLRMSNAYWRVSKKPLLSAAREALGGTRAESAREHWRNVGAQGETPTPLLAVGATKRNKETTFPTQPAGPHRAVGSQEGETRLGIFISTVVLLDTLAAMFADFSIFRLQP